jgi:hypothetical protein
MALTRPVSCARPWADTTLNTCFSLPSSIESSTSPYYRTFEGAEPRWTSEENQKEVIISIIETITIPKMLPIPEDITGSDVEDLRVILEGNDASAATTGLPTVTPASTIMARDSMLDATKSRIISLFKHPFHRLGHDTNPNGKTIVGVQPIVHKSDGQLQAPPGTASYIPIHQSPGSTTSPQSTSAPQPPSPVTPEATPEPPKKSCYTVVMPGECKFNGEGLPDVPGANREPYKDCYPDTTSTVCN